MAYKLASKKYLVTGAGRGFGRAITKALSEMGCKVYALSLSKGPLDSLVAENPDVTPIVADVGNWNEIRDKLGDVETLDGLVNNAGQPSIGFRSCFEWSKDSLEHMVNVQLLGAINISQIIGQKMVEDKRPGSIVNISSVLSLQAYPMFMPYTVTKAGLDMVTKQFALELGPYNIRVNSVNPTLVLTEPIQSYIDSGVPMDGAFLYKTPMKRLPEVNEIVKPVLYFLSDESSMVNGTINVVDGGLMSAFCTQTWL